MNFTALFLVVIAWTYLEERTLRRKSQVNQQLRKRVMYEYQKIMSPRLRENNRIDSILKTNPIPYSKLDFRL
jgi:phage regulator Rha-like protein